MGPSAGKLVPSINDHAGTLKRITWFLKATPLSSTATIPRNGARIHVPRLLHVDGGIVPLHRVQRIVRHEHRVHAVPRLRVLDVGLRGKRLGGELRIGCGGDRDDLEIRVRRCLHRRCARAGEHRSLRRHRGSRFEFDDDAPAKIRQRARAADAIVVVRPGLAWRIRIANARVNAGRRNVRHQRAERRQPVLRGDDGADGDDGTVSAATSFEKGMRGATV